MQRLVGSANDATCSLCGMGEVVSTWTMEHRADRQAETEDQVQRKVFMFRDCWTLESHSRHQAPGNVLYLWVVCVECM